MRRLFAVVVVQLAALTFGAPPAVALVPQTINYQALLLGSNEAPVRDSSYSLTFRLYDVASGGAALWTETQPAVSTSKGVFSVVLGSVTAINLAFNAPYFLGISIGAAAELVPRTGLTSSACANTARELQVPWAKFQSYSGTLGVIANTLNGGGGALSLEGYSASLSTPVLIAINNTATGGYGVHAVAHVSGANAAAGTYSEVIGTGGTGTAGVVGVAPANYGLDGESTAGTGLLGRSVSGPGIAGMTGVGDTPNSSAGVSGSNASTGAGGYGIYASHSGSGLGAYALSAQGTAVWAATSGTATSLQALHGEISTTQSVTSSVAVEGENFTTSGAGYGVEGVDHSIGVGVYGHTDGAGFGVVGVAGGRGIAILGEGLVGAEAGRFQGDVMIDGTLTVNGILTKTTGSFKIDHPLDPANKYLYHSFVESPQRKNLYDGIVTTDESGEAEVVLPAYFEALNQNFRYQLTAVESGAQVWISQEIHDNRFRVRSDPPRVKVSWQVTGERHDAAALAHPMIVEVAKAASERGKYIDPRAFGKPEALGVGYEDPTRTRFGANVGGR